MISFTRNVFGLGLGVQDEDRRTRWVKRDSNRKDTVENTPLGDQNLFVISFYKIKSHSHNSLSVSSFCCIENDVNHK